MAPNLVTYNAAIAACASQLALVSMHIYMCVFNCCLCISFVTLLVVGMNQVFQLNLGRLALTQLSCPNQAGRQSFELRPEAHCFHWRHASELLMSLRKEALQALIRRHPFSHVQGELNYNALVT